MTGSTDRPKPPAPQAPLGRWLRGQRPDPDWVIPERIDLWRALGELKPRHRAALLLNVVIGYTQAEVARRVGIVYEASGVDAIDSDA